MQGAWGEAKDKADDAWEGAKDKVGDVLDRDDDDNNRRPIARSRARIRSHREAPEGRLSSFRSGTYAAARHGCRATVSRLHENRGMAAIDRFLPEWDVNELHEHRAGRSSQSRRSPRCSPRRGAGRVRFLLRLRGLNTAGSIESVPPRLGFEPLAREAGEVVVRRCRETVAAPRHDQTPSTAPRQAPSGSSPISSSGRSRTVVRVYPPKRGSPRWTTTRVTPSAATGVVVGPFSALIRRRWLAAARRSVARG